MPLRVPPPLLVKAIVTRRVESGSHVSTSVLGRDRYPQKEEPAVTRLGGWLASNSCVGQTVTSKGSVTPLHCAECR